MVGHYFVIVIFYLLKIYQSFAQAKEEYAVMCVQHDYTPKPGIKWMVKNKQFILEKLSSLVLWNCGHPSNKIVTKELVNDPDTTGKVLHRFSWLKDEEIGSINHEWNL